MIVSKGRESVNIVLTSRSRERGLKFTETNINIFDDVALSSERIEICLGIINRLVDRVALSS